MGQAGAGPPLAQLLAGYEDRERRRASPPVIKNNLSVLRAFLRQAGDGLGSFTTASIDDFLRRLADTGHAPKTVENRRIVLATFCHYAMSAVLPILSMALDDVVKLMGEVKKWKEAREKKEADHAEI